jgi:hypothetical protein
MTTAVDKNLVVDCRWMSSNQLGLIGRDVVLLELSQDVTVREDRCAGLYQKIVTCVLGDVLVFIVVGSVKMEVTGTENKCVVVDGEASPSSLSSIEKEG